MRRLVRIALSAMLLFAFAQDAARAADDEPSVLVRIEPVRRGSLPDIVVGYGSVAYDAASITTLSLQQDGRVTRVAVTPGEAVSSGQLLIGFSRSAQAASRLAEARSALSLALQQRLHSGQLLSQHLVTRDQLAQAGKAVQDAQSNLDALQSEGAGNAYDGLEAPFDGVVQGIPISVGDRVAAGVPLVTLARNDGLIVTAGIEPGLRSRLRPGQEVAVVALQDGRMATGHLLRIGGQLNPRTHLVDIAISLAAHEILAGEAVRAELTVGQPVGWLVPRAALTTEPGIRNHEILSIYQVENGHALRIPVVLAAEQGGQDLISGALDATRPLVIDGVHQLTNGAAIRLRH